MGELPTWEAFSKEVPLKRREAQKAAEGHLVEARSYFEVVADLFQGKVVDFREEIETAGQRREVGLQQEAGILDLGQALVAEGQAHLQQVYLLR